VASADATASAEYEEQLTVGMVLAVAEALAVEGEEVLLAAVFAPPQAARSITKGKSDEILKNDVFTSITT
jgi:hypothetical protein